MWDFTSHIVDQAGGTCRVEESWVEDTRSSVTHETLASFPSSSFYSLFHWHFLPNYFLQSLRVIDTWMHSNFGFSKREQFVKENVVRMGEINIFVLLFLPNSNNFYSQFFLYLNKNYRKYLCFKLTLISPVKETIKRALIFFSSCSYEDRIWQPFSMNFSTTSH